MKGVVMNGWKTLLSKLHRDEKGADMVEYILILAAIGIPLLAVVIWFWKDISGWVAEKYGEIKDGSGGTDPSDF
jgi:Flp pilus assembly pilin Flp